MKRRRFMVILCAVATPALALAGCGTWIYLYAPWYHFSVSETKQGVALRALQLGEYFTPVTELVIEDESHCPVVEFRAKTDRSMMHTIDLQPGRCKFRDLYLDGYEIEGADYEFRTSIEYTARVWWGRKESKVNFRLQEKEAEPGATDNPDGAQRFREDH